MKAYRTRSTSLVSAIPALTLLLYLVLSEPPAVLLLFFGAVAAHEWGHLLAFHAIGVKHPVFTLTGVGARLSPRFPLLPWQEAVVALSGPLCNLLFAFFALRMGRGDFFLLLAALHLLFGLCNLLPFGMTDGERLLSLLLFRLVPKHAPRILRMGEVLFLSVFFYFSLFLHYLTGNGICGIFFCLFFFLDEKNHLGNLF